MNIWPEPKIICPSPGLWTVCCLLWHSLGTLVGGGKNSTSLPSRKLTTFWWNTLSFRNHIFTNRSTGHSRLTKEFPLSSLLLRKITFSSNSFHSCPSARLAFDCMLNSHTRTEEQWAPFPLKMLTQYCFALIRFLPPKCRRLQDFCVIWPMLWPLWMECANNAGLADQSLPRPPPLKQRHYVTAALRWPCLHTVHCKLNCSTILGQIYPAGCTTIVLHWAQCSERKL